MDLKNFSDEESSAITQFRKIMKQQKTVGDEGILDDDLILYKFLKARNFNLDQAARMLKKNIEWRKENQIDRILLDYKKLEVLDLYLPQNFLGFDKEGCPVRYFATGNIDANGLFKSATAQDVVKSAIHFLETDIQRAIEQSKRLKRTVSSCLFIYNFEHLTLAKALDKRNLDTFSKIISLMQDNYPERLRKIIVINAPAFFSIPFALVKTVMAKEVMKKIEVYGNDGWKEALLEEIDDDVLPAFLGGKRTDPNGDPLCKTFITHGGVIPEKYYFVNNKQDFSRLPGIVKLTLKKCSRKEISFDIDRNGSFLEWEFEVKPKDIGFGLAFEFNDNSKTEIEELIKVQRVETPISTVSGRYYCDKKGKYIIIFDNSHSLMTSKDVLYKIMIN